MSAIRKRLKFFDRIIEGYNNHHQACKWGARPLKRFRLLPRARQFNPSFLSTYRRFGGAIAFAVVATHCPASAQPAEHAGQQASQAIPVAAKASVPLSECPSIRSAPIAAAWCSLTQASPVLQSVQIIVLSLLGLAALRQTVFVRKRRRDKLVSRGLTKHTLNIETARLTSLTENFGTGWFVAGFSGRLWKVCNALTADLVCPESVGLVRSLVQFRGRDAVLIGGDDGVLHAVDAKTGGVKRLATLGSPIYRLTAVSDFLFVAGLGSGEVAVLEIQHSPGQSDFSFRELWRTKVHAGSTFDVQPTRAGFVSVGADGRFVEIDEFGVMTASTKTTDSTIWSVAEIAPNAFILGCNDGNLIRIETGKIVASAKIHQSAARLVLRSPKGLWCISLGKDRSVFATLADLSSSVLLHRSNDYLYDGSISEDGQIVLVCDGAGDVIKIDFGRPLDSYDYATLAARVI